MNLSDLKIGQEIITHYTGYYIPKGFTGIKCKIENISRKLITVSSIHFTGTYKISLDNIARIIN